MKLTEITLTTLGSIGIFSLVISVVSVFIGIWIDSEQLICITVISWLVSASCAVLHRIIKDSSVKAIESEICLEK